MRLMRRAALAFTLLLLALATWVWWNKPASVDMATYAPRSSLVYLESNSVYDVATTITSLDAWKTISPALANNPHSSPALTTFAKWTGLGPARLVVASRAQVAAVMLDLGTTEEGTTLKVRPEAAILIETHTSSRRIRPLVEHCLKTLAEATFQNPEFTQKTGDGVDYLIWNAPSGSRQIVATIDNSLVIVGNSESVVDKCLAVRRGQQPALQTDPELQAMRQRISSEHALAFGFASSANAARLITFAMPLLLGRAEIDNGLDRLISMNAGQVIGSIGWGSFQSGGAIEDRYLINIQQPVLARLRPAFESSNSDELPYELLPESVYSVTHYRFQDPLKAWESLKDGLQSRADAVSAVLLSSLLKSALLTYGIDDPEKFLALVGPTVLTVRTRSESERSMLIARVREHMPLKALLKQKFRPSQTVNTSLAETFETKDDDLLAAFANDYLLIGPRADVENCLGRLESINRIAKPRPYGPVSGAATILTYTNDSERVRNFKAAIQEATSNSQQSRENVMTESSIAELPYAVTETKITSEGIERRTRSPFGQFSSIAALLFPSKQ